MLHGQRVRFTMDNLGMIGADEVVMSGEYGTYMGKHPMLEDGWVLVEPENHPKRLCPVTASMIEAVGRDGLPKGGGRNGA